MSDREAWERELREELPARLAEYQQELASKVTAERREWLTWHIRRVEKRMTEVHARLAMLGEAR